MNPFNNLSKKKFATYGAERGNAPALFTFDSVGHLRVASFFNFLNIKCYECSTTNSCS